MSKTTNTKQVILSVKLPSYYSHYPIKIIHSLANMNRAEKRGEKKK